MGSLPLWQKPSRGSRFASLPAQPTAQNSSKMIIKESLTKEENKQAEEPNHAASDEKPPQEQEAHQEVPQQEPKDDAYLRLLAEFENFKKRTEKEQQYWLSHIKKVLLVNLLPILDDFERALSHNTATKDQEQQGLTLIYKKLFQILEKEGLKTMKVNVGAPFDANAHEALSTRPNDDEAKKDTIAQVVHPGYLLNEEIIRFAKVIVNAS